MTRYVPWIAIPVPTIANQEYDCILICIPEEVA